MSEIDLSKKKRFKKKAATDPDQCLEMAEKYGWESTGFTPTGDPTLSVD